MPVLQLRFSIRLENRDPHPKHFGPLFHRWLPDGERDAIVLRPSEPNTELRVWFERKGFVSHGEIVYDGGRREVDTNIIPTQGALEAGPLLGLLKVEQPSEVELAPVREGRIGDVSYTSLGKRVIRLIYAPVSSLLRILRTNYGQYWIEELENWDSRSRSLGSYCKSVLGLEWSLDDGGNWGAFIPDDHLELGMMPMEDRGRLNYRTYLAREDWQEIAILVQHAYEPSLAALTLARAHQLHDQGNLKEAIIEAVTALEVAVKELIRTRLGSLQSSANAFLDLKSEKAQMAVLTAALGDVSHLEGALKCIQRRHDIVHDAVEPPQQASIELSELMEAIALLLSGPRVRFPWANPGNVLMSAEQWDRSGGVSPVRMVAMLGATLGLQQPSAE